MSERIKWPVELPREAGRMLSLHCWGPDRYTITCMYGAFTLVLDTARQGPAEWKLTPIVGVPAE